MGISLKPEHLKRYGQIARLLLRYGRTELVKKAGLEEALDDEALEEEVGEEPGEAPKAEELAADLEAMGPTFIKLGQLLSTRVDLLPPAYTEALVRLQDEVEPFPFAEVETIVEEELGVRISKAFLEFDARPLAAASLGQVHRAMLRDGRAVAVKVQRPGIREQIAADFEALAEIASFLDHHTEAGQRYEFRAVLGELHRTLLRELDYRKEASNLTTLGGNLARFDLIIVPRPVEDYTTSRVLTMDYVRGRKVTALSPLALMEIDGEQLAEQLFDAYLKQILVDGFFHADPHPGNVFLTDDGRIALLDVGMTGRVSPDLQGQLLQLLLALSEGRGEDASEILVRMGTILSSFDGAAFQSRISQIVLHHFDQPAEELQVGRVLVEVTRTAGENGLRVPPQLTMLGKTLLNLDQVGRVLDPEFEPNNAIRRNAAELMRQRMLKSASPGQIFSSMLELNDFAQELPRRLNRVLDTVAGEGMSIQLHINNEAVLLSGLQKIANRVAMGVVLAALIIGAAMLMRVETRFRIFGYPGLAMLLFLAAVIGGILMVGDIVLHDRHGKA
jgi:predicted unusual protein kinase regulating ubiquinone biosynthesis (AarF/ABC1/UbiB family)